MFLILYYAMSEMIFTEYYAILSYQQKITLFSLGPKYKILLNSNWRRKGKCCKLKMNPFYM